MIIMMFFLLSVAVLGIVIYKYLHHEQDKFISRDRYDEAWNGFFKNSTQKKRSFTRRNNILRNIFIGVISAIILITASGYCYFSVMFSGGINGYTNNLINNLKPELNPNSPVINAKREAATEEVNQSFDELQNILHYNYYETATGDFCFEGRDSSWKTSGSAGGCSLEITKFYGFDGDFRQQMIDFEKKIRSIGWTLAPYNPDDSMEKMLEHYYDPPTGTYYSRYHDVSELPTPGPYVKGSLTLHLDYVEEKSRDISDLDWMQGYGHVPSNSIYAKTNFVDSRTVFNKITKINRFVLVIQIGITHYFLN